MPNAIAAQESRWKRIRIFISSPSDLTEERLAGERVVERLQAEFLGAAVLEPILWEDLPLTAERAFQDQIPLPSEVEIVVLMLWSRLGSRLHSKYKGGEDEAPTGTLFEFRNALEGRKRTNRFPDIMVYRKTAEPPKASIRDPLARRKEEEEWRKVDDFFARTFIDQREGVFTGAFHQFTRTTEFEAVFEKHLRKLVQSHLADATQEIAPSQIRWPWDIKRQGSPFRGLAYFDFEHAPIFFGRAEAATAVRNALRNQAANGKAFVLVTGASGLGKSSLVRAGVVPSMVQPGVVEGVSLWRRAVVGPKFENGDLFLELAHGLLCDGALPELVSAQQIDATKLAPQLRSSPAAAVFKIEAGLGLVTTEARLREEAKLQAKIADLQKSGDLAQAAELQDMAAHILQPRARLVLIVDQLEEIFTTAGTTAEEREKFIAAIDAMARSGLVWVIATLRSDFHGRLSELPQLVVLMEGAGEYIVRPPTREELGQMIRLPALAAGLRFQERSKKNIGLDEILRDEASSNPQALPLLEFALDEIYRRREAQPDGTALLTVSAYAKLRTIRGALGLKAEETFRSLGTEAQQAFAKVMRGIVTLSREENATFTRRWANYGELTAAPAAATFVDAFIKNRLFVADAAKDDPRGSVSVAHEALFSSWPRLRRWLNSEKDFLKRRARLSQEVAFWKEQRQEASYLLEGRSLHDALALIEDHRSDLNADEIAFIERSKHASELKSRKRQRALVTVALIFLVLAILSAAGAFFGFRGEGRARVAQKRAESEKSNAQKTLSRSDFFQAVRLLEGNDAANALAYLARSLRSDPENRASSDLISAQLLQRNWPLQIGEPSILDASILTASFSPDASKAVTISYDNTVRLWNTKTGVAITPPLKQDAAPFSAVFSPDGNSVLIACYNYSARVWNAANGQPQAPAMKHQDGLESALFSPDGGTIVTSSGDKVYCWESRTGTPVRDPIQAEGQVNYAAFSRDGAHVVIATWEAAHVWDARSGKSLGVPIPHEGVIKFCDFTPDGKAIFTVTWDNVLRFWNWQTGEALTTPLHHGDYIQSVAFNADGAKILTASKDRTARLWDAKTGRELAEPMRHGAAVLAATFSTNGESVFTIAGDYNGRGTTAMWDVRDGRAFPQTMSHQDAVNSIEFDAAGGKILSASKDNTARIWDVQSGQPLTAPLQHEDAVQCAAFSPDANKVLTGSLDGTARLWDAKTGGPIGAPLRHDDSVQAIAFSPDGTRVATASKDHTARIWNVAAPNKSIILRHADAVVSVNFGPDGRRLVTACADNTARVWDAQSGKEVLAPLQHEVAMEGSHETGVVSATFSPDGKQIVTAGKDDTARIWNAQSGAPIGTAMRHDAYVISAVFAPDGRRVLTASSEFGKPGSARIWDAATGYALIEPMKHDDGLTTAAFNRAGTRVITSSYDKTARIWDPETSRALSDSFRHEQLVTTANFSPNGKQIATGSLDGTIRIWEVFATDEPFRSVAADLAESVGRIRLNSLGIPDLTPVKIPFANDSPFLQWFRADRSTRSPAPSLAQIRAR